MGFGGSVQAMITSLKNNDRRRKKRKPFDKDKVGGYGESSKPEYDFPEATPEVLSEIRERLRKERKTRMIKIIIVTVALVIAVVWLSIKYL